MEIKEFVTVVPADKLIVVNGEALLFDFTAPGIRALQWYNGNAGHIEWGDKNDALSLGDYVAKVLPYVQAWEAEKARLEAEAQKQAEEAEALYNSPEERAKRIRTARDAKLNATQWLVERHADELAGGLPTTLSTEEYARLLVYRQALREIPEQSGFPWEGVETVPWPEYPL